MKTTGTVETWQGTFGFIRPKGERHPNVFVHYQAITGEGYKRLYPGDEVEFDLINTPGGLQAKNVRKL